MALRRSGLHTKHRPALPAFEWKFLPSADLREVRVPSHPPVQPPHPPGLDLEAQYSAFLEDARRARLANPQLATGGWLESPGRASMLVAQHIDGGSRADGLDAVPRALEPSGAAAGAAGGDADVAAVLHELEAQPKADGSTAPEASTRLHAGAGDAFRAHARERSTMGNPVASGSAGPRAAAAADEDEDDKGADDDDDERYLPSPVIIWRPAAPVRIATNIPAELLPMAPSARDHDGAVHSAEAASLRRRAPPPRPKPVANTWNRPAARKPLGAHGDTPAALPFGAWYLPSESWGKPAPPHDGEAAVELARVRDPSRFQLERDSAADAAAAGITAKLATLYSSKMYRKFLRQNGARVPSYLQRVETPKAAHRRSGASGAPGAGGAAAGATPPKASARRLSPSGAQLAGEARAVAPG